MTVYLRLCQQKADLDIFFLLYAYCLIDPSPPPSPISPMYSGHKHFLSCNKRTSWLKEPTLTMWCFLSFKSSSRSTTEFFKCFLLYLLQKNKKNKKQANKDCRHDCLSWRHRQPNGKTSISITYVARFHHFFPPRLTILDCFPKNSHCFKLGLQFLKGSKWSKQPNVYCNICIEYEVERHFVQLIKYHVNAFICILTGVYSVIVFDTQNNIEKKNLKAMTLNTFKCINTRYFLKYRRA